MIQERDFLKLITHEPEDDAPRLVFADWLEEHGQPERAEFIRAQLRLAELAEDSPQRRELAFRCRQLLDIHERQWLEPLCGMVLEWTWSRGFVEVMDHDPGSLADFGVDHFETYPIRRLILCDLFGGLDALALIPAANQLTALELLGNDLGLRALRKLPKFRQLGGLQELNLMFNRLRDSAVEFLCAEPFFQNLSLLRLGCNPFTDRGRQRLRDHFGRRVSFVRERYPERLYAIQDTHLRVGWGHDLTQLVMVATMEQIRVAVFDHAGNLVRIERRQVPQEAGLDHWAQEERRVAVRDPWLAELGYQSATVKVKRFNFEPDWGGIHDFADGWCDEFDRPRSPEIENARGWLDRWLGNDKFAQG